MFSLEINQRLEPWSGVCIPLSYTARWEKIVHAGCHFQRLYQIMTLPLSFLRQYKYFLCVKLTSTDCIYLYNLFLSA